MARSNGTVAAFAALAGLAGIVSCAALESWDQAAGGGDGAPGPSDASRVDSSLADARVEDAGIDSAIAFVQVNAVSPENKSAPTLAVPYPKPQIAGDLNVVAVGWYDDATVDSIADAAGNTYRLAVGPTASGGTNPSVQAIYYASGIVAAAANANVVTVRWNKSTDSPDVRVLEYRGLDRKDPLDVAATMSGRSATASSGALTTRFAPALLVAAGTTESGFSLAGTGFTSQIITAGACIAADRIVTTVGTYSTEAPLQSSDTWVMQLAAFH